MTAQECSVEGCLKVEQTRRGFCGKHYKKWSKYGDPLAGYFVDRLPLTASVSDRLWNRVSVGRPDECWEWHGATVKGYGHLSDDNGRNVLAHRLAYVLDGNSLNDSEILDHECYNPPCVNPRHLRKVSHKQNMEHLRGARKTSSSGVRGVQRNGPGWMARVRHNGETHYLGTYPTIEEADAAARKKRAELFTHDDYEEWARKRQER